MYQEIVFSNIEKATAATKKESPGTAIFCFIAALLLGLNAFGLLFKGIGLKLRFIDPAVCGILSAILAVLLLGAAFMFLKDRVKTGKADADVRFKEQYMNQVRQIGAPEVVLADAEKLQPIICGDRELRYSDRFVACTSAANLDSNFIYPLAAMTNIGTGGLGTSKGAAGQPYLFMHFRENGKKVKRTVYIPPTIGNRIVQEITSYNPNIKVGA